MLSNKRKRATLVPQKLMQCPCCYDKAGFELTYQLHETRDPTLLKVEQKCSCKIPDVEAERLARHELRGFRI